MSVYRYYWDANIFHALFNDEAGRVENCKYIAKQAESGTVMIVTSALTLVECVRLHGQPRKLTAANEAVIKKFFECPFIEVVNVTRKIGEEARQHLWTYDHLKYKDAIHVATAAYASVDALHTYDQKDLVVLDGKIGSLKICVPPVAPPQFNQSSMFDKPE
jgi:predicted nucleic acid-binding protein